MVDVGDKDETERVAVAEARVAMSPETAAAVARGDAPKGDVIGTARLAGIQAAKRTFELIPLAHPLALNFVDVTAHVDVDAGLRDAHGRGADAWADRRRAGGDDGLRRSPRSPSTTWSRASRRASRSSASGSSPRRAGEAATGCRGTPADE